MERPERPSRPEKGIRSGGGHPYRERHRIVSSDSESDMELDLTAPVRTIRTMRLQRPSRPSVEALTSIPQIQNSNSLATSTSSATSSDPYHLPSPIRIRENAGDTQSLYPFMLKEDGSHRSPALFYRKRNAAAPPHFVSPLSNSGFLSDVLERRSNSRNCVRVRFPSPHTSAGSSSNWEAKRFCSGPPGGGGTDSLSTGPPDQKLASHRVVPATVSSSCLLEPHPSSANADRPDRDDIRMRSHHPWSNPAAGASNEPLPPPPPPPGSNPSNAPSSSASGSLLQFFEETDNNTLRNLNMENDEELDIGNVGDALTEPNGRSAHNSIGYRPGGGHSSSLQQSDTNNDLPTRASSHILRALDELRFTPMREPWLHVEHIEHSVAPGLDLPPCRPTNGSHTAFNNNSPTHPIFRRRMDFNVVDSDNEHDDDGEALIDERVPGDPDPVPVEEVSDLDEYDTITEDSHESRNQIAVLTHPSDSTAMTNNIEECNGNNHSDVNFVVENARNDSFVTNNQRDPLTNDMEMVCDSNENNCNMTATGTGGTGDDIIILTMSPSPHRQQPPEVHALTTQHLEDTTNYTTITQPQQPLVIPITPQHQNSNSAISNAITNSSASSCSMEENLENINRLDSEEINSKLVSLLECPVCMETIVPPIQQCRKGHPVCQICRPKLTVCPTCRSRFSENRNLLMEKVAEMMLFPCKNVHMGCVVKVQLKDKKKHELSCGFRQYDCIVGSCTWKGFKQELVVHVSSVHKSQVIVGNNQKVRVPLQANLQTTWVLSVMDEVFVVTFINKDRILTGCTVYLGNVENANNYVYEFTISNKDSMRYQWQAKTFADKGPMNSLSTKGFFVPVNHCIIEDHDHRLLNKIDVTVNIFKSDPLSTSPACGDL